MVAEFNWWLLIVGVVAGGVLTWLVLADTTRREREISDEELLAEAAWITKAVGGRVPPEVAEDVLRAHRRYLGFPPPDVLVAPEDLPALEAEGVDTEPPADLVEPAPDDVASVESASVESASDESASDAGAPTADAPEDRAD